MAKFELLNNVDHKNLRVITSRSAQLGDNIWYAATIPEEFRNLQRHYPIVFSKSPDSERLQPVALFGFEKGENLFLNDESWDASYIPLNIMRQPFLIGFQEVQEGGTPAQQMVVSVDMDNPRVNETEGEAVFLEHGGTTEYLEQVNSILNAIHQGIESNSMFVDMLLGMDLLESFVLEVQLNDGSEHRMSGFYTINEPSLAALKGEDLVNLNNKGYLEAIYMAIASMSNIPALVERKNQLLEDKLAHAVD